MSAQNAKEVCEDDRLDSSAKATLRVLIVDDQKVSRDSIREVLELFPTLELAGEVETGELAIQFVISSRPDLVLMDLNLPGINGLDATRQLKQLYPEIVIFV